MAICEGTARPTHSSIVVQMDFNVTADDTTQRSDEIIDLTGIRAPDCVRDTDTVDADFVYGLVDRKEVDKVRSEGVLGGESDLNALGLDEVDDLDRGLSDVGHILAMRELS